LTKEIIDYPKLNYNNLTEQDKYDLQWYVIGETTQFLTNIPKKATIWNKNYVVWKDQYNKFHALDDVCPHKSASLSGGYVKNDNIVCPYHGYEFNCQGELKKVPGICFQPSEVYDLPKYDIVEKNGWVYLNTQKFEKGHKASQNSNIEVDSTKDGMNTYSDIIHKNQNDTSNIMVENIFEEEEVVHNDSVVFLHMDFNCYSRILSENSLDVMHIGFVHTFGNTKNPAPIEIHPPRMVGPHHYKTSYMYEAGENSIARKVFNVKDLIIENEFVLPHTTVARIIFGSYVNTVVTFALPISENKSRLFVKTYRNFWQNPLGDIISEKLMFRTMMEDRSVVENIDPNCIEGKFNMRFDKLQNTYKRFYKKFIHKKK